MFFKPVDSDWEAQKSHDYNKHINYYKVLGVAQTATTRKIDEHHDMLDGLLKLGLDILDANFKDTLKEMENQGVDHPSIKKEIHAAHQVLSDQATRRQYDRDRDYMKAYAEISGVKEKPDKAS